MFDCNTCGRAAQGIYAVNSFKELEAKISALESDNDKGATFEVFAEAFLVIQEGIDPGHYWPQGTEPQLLRESLGLPRGDFGIDSVYLNHTQQYDACQCKFRTGRPTLAYGRLATFLATAKDDKFQNKVLFTNCEDVVHYDSVKMTAPTFPEMISSAKVVDAAQGTESQSLFD